MHRVVATLILLGAYGVDAVAAQEACVLAPSGGTACGKLGQPDTARPAWPSPSQPNPSPPSLAQPNFSQPSPLPPSPSQPGLAPPSPSQAPTVASRTGFDEAVRRGEMPNEPRRVGSQNLRRGH